MATTRILILTGERRLLQRPSVCPCCTWKFYLDDVITDAIEHKLFFVDQWLIECPLADEAWYRSYAYKLRLMTSC